MNFKSLFNSKKTKRAEWVASLTLPKYNGELPKLGDVPFTIHPKIDPYLTANEKADLLERFGWIRRVTIEGKELCYIPRNMSEFIMAMHGHFAIADNLKGVTDDYLPGVDGRGY